MSPGILAICVPNDQEKSGMARRSAPGSGPLSAVRHQQDGSRLLSTITETRCRLCFSAFGSWQLKQARDSHASPQSLRLPLEHLSIRLKGHTDSYSRGRVSSQHMSARSTEKGISDNLDRLVALDETEDIQTHLDSLIHVVRFELENVT